LLLPLQSSNKTPLDLLAQRSPEMYQEAIMQGLGWVGLGWVGLGWVGLGWVRFHDRARSKPIMRNTIVLTVADRRRLHLVRQRHWQPAIHYTVPERVQSIVATMMMIRAIEHSPSSILLWMPNELLFEIFSLIEY
jgi:hypothetical protein